MKSRFLSLKIEWLTTSPVHPMTLDVYEAELARRARRAVSVPP